MASSAGKQIIAMQAFYISRNKENLISQKVKAIRQ